MPVQPTRGRPPVNSGPVVAVTVDGLPAAWCDGYFSGDTAVIAAAKLAADLGLEVWVFGSQLTADDTTAVGAFAAMASFAPGRVWLVNAPDDVLALADHDVCGEGE